ncbi:hypothetical protein Lac1_14620 [Claveliimonas bilis]|uniref:Uncharacterized protein n=1 Tax=Claveliimonas bilis TaxID=3028070 RepID=A0ABN6Z1L4_9FIRM|nr:hypothetical protein Lac1_14620 [Claveliimonas bilis]
MAGAGKNEKNVVKYKIYVTGIIRKEEQIYEKPQDKSASGTCCHGNYDVGRM